MYLAEMTRREKRTRQLQEATRVPIALNDAHRTWLYQHEGQFRASMGNSRGWTATRNVVRECLIDSFLLAFFPDISENEREQCLEPVTLVCYLILHHYTLFIYCGAGYLLVVRARLLPYNPKW
jgi:hypothetical protein